MTSSPKTSPHSSLGGGDGQADGQMGLPFTFDGLDWLLKCKWQRDPVGASHLDSLGGKIQRKLDNTLGLFLSINGFSDDGIAAYSKGRSVMILSDGADLMAVVEGRITLDALIRRKRAHAAQTGEIFLPVGRILG